jgi:NAD(P)-dependent dehydrogenase (short-subunit alcohol dehydrogenase family)
MNAARQPLTLEPPPFECPPLPPGTFAGQVALVTGGGSGMGLGMALAFAQAGASIAVVGRSLDRAAEGVRRVAELGARAVPLSADVRDPTQVRAAFDAAEAALGPVSLLANNAGSNFPAIAERLSTNAWNAVTRIAIDGTFLCSAEFARRRIAAGEPGAIVNNSAQYIWTGFPGDAHSAAAKTAVATMTRAMALEWAPHRIRVNCVAAGFFPHAGIAGSEEPETLAAQGAMIPAGRTGRMREFGWISAFVCSPWAAALTGQVVMIDGGESLRRALMSPPYVPPRERGQAWDYRA